MKPGWIQGKQSFNPQFSKPLPGSFVNWKAIETCAINVLHLLPSTSSSSSSSSSLFPHALSRRRLLISWVSSETETLKQGRTTTIDLKLKKRRLSQVWRWQSLHRSLSSGRSASDACSVAGTCSVGSPVTLPLRNSTSKQNQRNPTPGGGWARLGLNLRSRNSSRTTNSSHNSRETTTARETESDFSRITRAKKRKRFAFSLTRGILRCPKIDPRPMAALKQRENPRVQTQKRITCHRRSRKVTRPRISPHLWLVRSRRDLFSYSLRNQS